MIVMGIEKQLKHLGKRVVTICSLTLKLVAERCFFRDKAVVNCFNSNGSGVAALI